MFIPVIPRGAVFADGVPMYDDSRTVNSWESGKALAEMLGKRRAVILHAHGAVVVADSVKALLFTHYRWNLMPEVSLLPIKAVKNHAFYGRKRSEKVTDFMVSDYLRKPGTTMLIRRPWISASMKMKGIGGVR